MSSLMLQEILEVPNLLIEQEKALVFNEKGQWIKALNPKALWLLARGSSAHAGHYLTYLWMRNLACPAGLIPLSLSTFYAKPWQSSDALLLSISQSGKSEDLLLATKTMRSSCLASIALLNDKNAPLAGLVDCALDIGAGLEKSVAATKSFVLSITAGLRLFAPFWQDKRLLEGLSELPSCTQKALLTLDEAVFDLASLERLFVIGRGLGFALAAEAALKFKETCLIQAEALSGAEVMHGPMALMNGKQWLLFFILPDEMQADLLKTAKRFQNMGAKVLLIAPERVPDGFKGISYNLAPHHDLHGISAILAFYQFIERLAHLKGLNPDAPPHLQKETSTR